MRVNTRCINSRGTSHTRWNIFTHIIIIVDRFYIALFSAVEQTHCARMWFYISEYLFIARFFCFCFLNIHRSGVLTTLAWLVPQETAAISARSVYTIQPCTMSLHAKPHTYARWTLYLLACQVGVILGNSGLCCCVCVIFRVLINSLVC